MKDEEKVAKEGTSGRKNQEISALMGLYSHGRIIPIEEKRFQISGLRVDE